MVLLVLVLLVLLVLVLVLVLVLDPSGFNRFNGGMGMMIYRVCRHVCRHVCRESSMLSWGGLEGILCNLD
eukprot:COSAG02_NODE_42414_length_384_cov_4.196491_1_plen_70_part_00